MFRIFLLWSRLTLQRKILLFQVVGLSIYAYFLMLFFQKKVFFGKKEQVFNNNSVDQQKVKDISFAIQTVAKYAFYKNVCRHQAYQAKLLCKWYKIPYSIFIGFKKAKNGKLEGHAWTMVKDKIITGKCNPAEYVVQAVYYG